MRRKEKEAPRLIRTCHCYSTGRKKRHDEDAQSRMKGKREETRGTGREEESVERTKRRGMGLQKEKVERGKTRGIKMKMDWVGHG